MSASRTIARAVINRSGLSSKMAMAPILNEEERITRQPSAPQTIDSETETRYSDSESEASGVEEDDDVEAKVDLSDLKDSVATSEAFMSFVKSVKGLICPTFDSELKNMSRVAREKRDKIDPYGVLGETLAELLYARPTEVFLSESDTYSRVDVFKDYVETLTGRTWNWWPLPEKKTKLQASNARLQWQCVSLERRHERRYR